MSKKEQWVEADCGHLFKSHPCPYCFPKCKRCGEANYGETVCEKCKSIVKFDLMSAEEKLKEIE